MRPPWWGTAFEQLAEITPARLAVVRWSGGEDGVVEWVNPAAAALVGLTPDEAVGRRLSEVYPERYLEEIVAQFRRAAEEGMLRYEVVRELPAGRLTLQAMTLPLGGDHFVSFALDVTREREAERQLAEVTDLTGAGLFHWNVPDHTTTWSDELFELLGYAPDTVEPGPELYIHHVHPDDVAPAEGAVAAARSGQGEVTVERHRVIRTDGEVRTVDVRSHRVLDEDGRVAYISGVVRDVTDEAVVERQAELVRRAAEQQRTALTVHDKVVQGLATVVLALDLGELDTARAEALAAVTAAQSVVADLLSEIATVQGTITPGALRTHVEDGP